MTQATIHYDCRHYVGSKPCRHKRACEGCGHYEAVAESILVIKLGALGDLFRTTPILPALRARYPKARITWLTQASCLPLLENLAEIDRLWVTDAHAAARVLAERFDLLINFDKDTPAAELATIAQAREKRGFGLSPAGSLVALNPESEYALRLGIDDELKFRVNQKTYQHVIHEMAALPVPSPMTPYQLRLTEAEKAFGADWLRENLFKREESFVLAVNPGAGRVFATKKWHKDRYIELASRLHREHGVVPLLLGGEDEADLNQAIHKTLKARGVPVLRPGETLTLRQFVSLVAQCDGFISGDTLGMHVALALGKPSVVLFTSTCHQEIELYGKGRALIGQAACAPCYRSKCNQPSQHCADSITVDQVFEAVSEHMSLGRQSGETRRRRSNV